MKGIFISYRREDTSGFARSLYQSLENHFGAGQVFMDVEGIELGLDFVEALDKSLANCQVLLVMIGKDWAICQDDAGNRRLDDPNDFVRMEVASALQRSDVRVIPVRVRGAAMPRTDELPEDLQALTRRQALELRHDSWNADVKILIDAVEGIVGPAASRQEPSPQESSPPPAPTRTAKAGGLLTKVLAVAGGVLLVLLAIPTAFAVDRFRRFVPRWRWLNWIIVAAAPILGWSVFATIYYGTPLPNPAYAKLWTGIPQTALWTQGLWYVV